MEHAQAYGLNGLQCLKCKRVFKSAGRFIEYFGTMDCRAHKSKFGSIVGRALTYQPFAEYFKR